MITEAEKIEIIEKRIRGIESQISEMNWYIDQINSGMEDPDYNLEECAKIIENMALQKNALISAKQVLTN